MEQTPSGGPPDQTLISTCDDCGRPFVYTVKKRRKIRKICPSCVWTRRKERKKDYNDRHRNKKPGELKLAGRPSAKGNVTGVIKHSHAEIARALKMKKHEVEALERQVLLKIRNDPQLKPLWSSFREVLAEGHGGNWMTGLVAEEDCGMRLLKYQMAVVEFWEVHDLLVEEMQETGKSFSAETTEILGEIRQLQSQIEKALRGQGSPK